MYQINMKKSFFLYKISFFLIFILSTATITYSWNGLIAENGDLISITKWNELVTTLNNKIEKQQLIAGSNITISQNGENLEISSINSWWSYPYISTTNPFYLAQNTNYDLVLEGENFNPNSQVNIPSFDGTINTVSVSSPQSLSVNLTTGNSMQSYDLVISNWWLLNSSWSWNGENLITIITPVLWTGPAGIYNETLESNSLGNWSDSVWNDANFTIQTGGTPSSGTGPTGAAWGSYYIFAETSNPNNPNKIFAIETTHFRQAQSLSFDYHMHGGNMGTLTVEILNGSTWTTAYTLQWQQQITQTDPWINTGNINISDKLVEKIRIRYSSGWGYQGDVSIDNISITSI